MGGVRLGGIAIIVNCSPPLTGFGGAATTGAPQVYRWCSTNNPGELTQYTDFTDFTIADQCHNPVLSPDRTKILFEISADATNYREVWVTDNIPGSTPVQLVADNSNYVIHPSWGPDSDTFTYVHCAGGLLRGGTVYKDTVSSPGSPTSLKVAGGGLSPFRPQFNFDGTRISYIMAQDVGSGSGELRVMDDDGTNDAAVFNTLNRIRFDQPAQHSWANAANIIAFETGAAGSNAVYIVNDDGTGLTQINANGDAAGAAAVISAFAWPPDDSYVVFSAHIGTPWSPVRAELDGSTTTQLGTTGGVNQNFFEAAIVYSNRIWFISATAASSFGARGRLSSMALDGTDERVDFDSSLGSGDMVDKFIGGDGFYYN